MPETHFNDLIGLEFDEIAPDRCVASIEVDRRLTQPYGIVHGGVYCSIIEAAASTGAATWAVEQGLPGVVGVHNSTDFIRATRQGTITATALPIRRGRTQQLWGVDVTRTDGELVARGQVRLQNLTDEGAIGGIDPHRTPEVRRSAAD